MDRCSGGWRVVLAAAIGLMAAAIPHDALGTQVAVGTQAEGGGIALAADLQSDSLAFDSDGITLRGLLRMPAGPGPHPAVLFLPGGGRQFLNLEPDYFAERLAESGVASLVFHKRGTGDSEGNWETATFDDLIADAGAAVEALRAHPTISDRIGVMGFSEGGRLAPSVAVRYGLDAVVGIVGPHTSPAATRSYALAQALTQVAARNPAVTDVDVDGAMALWDEYFTAVLEYQQAGRGASDERGHGSPVAQGNGSRVDPRGAGASIAHLDARIVAARLRLPLPLLPDPSTSFRPSPYLNSLTFSSREDLLRLDVPYLAMYGAADNRLPSMESVALLGDVFAETGRANLTLIVIAGSGHALNDAAGERHPLYRTLPVDWLVERLAP